MFKLIGVGGQVRGKRFSLSEGSNVFGSDMDASFQLELKGISKKHFDVVVNDEFLTVLDLNSSNGTFVNKKMIEEKSVREGDVIAIPNAIFQVVKVKKEKIKKQVNSIQLEEEIPRNVSGKIGYHFKKNIFPMFFSLNKSWEWKPLVSGLFFLSILVTVFFSVDSVMSKAKKLIKGEVVSRAKQYLEEANRRNAAYMFREEFDQLNVSFLAQEKTITGYSLFDKKGIILNSDSKKNIYISAPFDVKAKEQISRKNNSSFHFVEFLGDGQIGVARGLFAKNLKNSREQLVGYVSIVFNPDGLVELENLDSIAYFESLIKSLIFAILIFYLIYLITINHFEVLYKESKEMMEGNKQQIEKEILFAELNPVQKTLNNMILRIKELSSGESNEFEELESDGLYVESLIEILKSYSGAGLVLNSDKYIKSLNSEAEDVLGIRENLSLDQDLSDVIRNQSTAAKIIQLCEETSSTNGLYSEDLGEINGVEYNISANCLMGKDGYPKAFIVSLRRE